MFNPNLESSTDVIHTFNKYSIDPMEISKEVMEMTLDLVEENANLNLTILELEDRIGQLSQRLNSNQTSQSAGSSIPPVSTANNLFARIWSSIPGPAPVKVVIVASTSTLLYKSFKSKEVSDEAMNVETSLTDGTMNVETSLTDGTMNVENESITNIAITNYLPKRSFIGLERVVSQETTRFLPVYNYLIQTVIQHCQHTVLQLMMTLLVP